jgi:serine/threonine-protein kinase RsbW
MDAAEKKQELKDGEAASTSSPSCDSCTQISELKLTAPGNIRYISVTVEFIKNCSRAFGFSEDEIFKIDIAAEEALSNIILNSLSNDSLQNYSVTCRRLPGKMEIVIHDKGLPFSPDEIPEYNPENPDDEENADGLGMYLLKSSVDNVLFRNLGRNGKETVLIVGIESERIDNLLSVSRQPEATDITPVDTKWHLRPFQPEDAIEISRCAYQTYGYTYEPYIYYPERITDMNNKGELLSIVAVDKSENLLAHIALKFYHHEDPIAEAGVAFVKPQYRKLGIFSKMCTDAFQRASDRGLFGVYGRAVTSHPLSQKKLTDFGFIDCGLMLGLFPSDVEFKALTGKTVQKESALLTYLPFKSPNRAIFPPARHSEIISDILSEASIPVKAVDSDNESATKCSDKKIHGDAELTYSRMEVFNTADIISYSTDISIIDSINSAKRKLCIEHTDVLYLYLDLEQPGCAKLADRCEKLGFFFCGVLPYGMHGRHTLILQYLNNIEIDFNKIKLNSPFAEKLLRYVEKDAETEKE